MGIFLIIVSGLATLIIAYKAWYKKDVTLVASVMSRFFLTLFIIIGELDSVNWLVSDMMIIGLIAVGTIMITDILVHTYYFFIKGYLKERENLRSLKVLGEIQNKYYLMTENAQSGIYVIDAKGRFEYVNPAVTRLSGYSKEEMLRMSVYDLVIPEQHGMVRERIKSKFNGEKMYTSYDVTITTKAGLRVNLHLVSYRTENGHPTVTGNVIVKED